MKVLLFGDSNTSGAFMHGKTWVDRFAEEMQARRDEPVEVVQKALHVERPGTVSYAETKLSEDRPDLVIVPASSYQFQAPLVWVRVERVFGKRAGDSFHKMERNLDSTTRHRGRVKERFTSTMRALAQTLIGGDPITSQEAVTQTYIDLMRVLSKPESIEVVFFPMPGRSKYARTRKAQERRAVFFSTLQAAAGQHRIAWADTLGAFAAIPNSVPLQTVDGLHYNERGHEIFYQSIIAAFDRAGVAVRDTSRTQRTQTHNTDPSEAVI